MIVVVNLIGAIPANQPAACRSPTHCAPNDRRVLAKQFPATCVTLRAPYAAVDVPVDGAA